MDAFSTQDSYIGPYRDIQGSTLRKKPWGQLAPKFSDLVTSKSISISEKHGKLVASEKKLVTLATPAVITSTSSSDILPDRQWFLPLLYQTGYLSLQQTLPECLNNSALIDKY